MLNLRAFLVLAVALSVISGCGLFLQPGDDGAGLIGYVVGDSVGDGYGVILKTEDGGVTWQRVGGSGIPDVDINEVRAIDRYSALASGAPSNGYGTILMTYDGGATWLRLGTREVIPQVEIDGLAAVNSRVAWAVGFNATILKTTDGGLTWVSQEAAGITANFSAVSAVDENTAWAVGDPQGGYAVVIHTTDGGATWTRQGSSEVLPHDGLIDVCAFDAQACWACGTDSTVLRTVNGGQSWEATNIPLSIVHYNGIVALGRDTAWTAIDDDGMGFTSDGGQTWDLMRIPTAEGNGYALLTAAATDAEHVWAAGRWFDAPTDPPGILLRTIDGGATWHATRPLPVNTALHRVSFVGSRK